MVRRGWIELRLTPSFAWRYLPNSVAYIKRFEHILVAMVRPVFECTLLMTFRASGLQRAGHHMVLRRSRAGGWQVQEIGRTHARDNARTEAARAEKKLWSKKGA